MRSVTLVYLGDAVNIKNSTVTKNPRNKYTQYWKYFQNSSNTSPKNRHNHLIPQKNAKWDSSDYFYFCIVNFKGSKNHKLGYFIHSKKTWSFYLSKWPIRQNFTP